MIAQEMAGSQEIRHDLARLLLWLRPDGGQARARRNAWASMVADRQRRNERTLAAREALVNPVLQAQVP
jgi:hypothetical protein